MSYIKVEPDPADGGGAGADGVGAGAGRRALHQVRAVVRRRRPARQQDWKF